MLTVLTKLCVHIGKRIGERRLGVNHPLPRNSRTRVTIVQGQRSFERLKPAIADPGHEQRISRVGTHLVELGVNRKEVEPELPDVLVEVVKSLVPVAQRCINGCNVIGEHRPFLRDGLQFRDDS